MISPISILPVLCLLQYTLADPCTSYTLLSGQYKRSGGYTLQSSDTAVSDNFLSTGWYRFDSGAGNDMVTSAPAMSQCGTLFPMWMQGTLPSDADGEVTRTVCIVGFANSCDSTLTIRVKSCGGYRVYYLVPAPQTATGYCIGEESPCPSDQTSASGFTPCQALSPVNTAPSVNVSLEYGQQLAQYQPLEAVFKCLHMEPSGGPYWYDTYWYINKDEVKVIESKPYQDNQSWLYPRDWVHKYNLNMVVKCSVRVRFSDGGTPGHHNYSMEFQAGIFPSSSTYSVKEGETMSIELTVSVPVGCFNIGFKEGCFAHLYIFTPEYQDQVGACQNYTEQGPVSFDDKACGIEIRSSSWWLSKTLNVTGKTDGFINAKDRDVFIRLGSERNGMDPSGVWDNVTIPDIKVFLYDVDKGMNNKLCYARTDPRMETFDKKYWTAQLAGEFIMYRDLRRKISVHALFSSCTWDGWLGQGPCGCGIAVRVENSLFVHRTCGEISYRYSTPLIHHDTVYHVCDNRHIVVETGNPWTKITLPTGAIVNYRVGHRWLYNIHITPSIFDEDNVDGLCGNPNNDDTDDFIPQGSTSATPDKNVFQSSWRVAINSTMSLFGPNPMLKSSDFELQKYCECATKVSNYTDPLSNHYTANCSIATPALICSRKTTSESFTSTCENYQNRYKREANDMDFSHEILRRSVDSDDVTDIPPLTVDPQFDPNFIPPTPTWKNGWTESTARSHCENAVLSDPARAECQKYIPMENRTNIAIEECILDIRDAGTTEFTSYTIESLKQFCFEEIKKYEIYYDTNGTQTESVVDRIGKIVCPNNCSDNGVCTGGVCICSASFVGFDCSHTKSTPPTNTSLPENGLCTTSKRECAKTNIYGYFLEENIHVKLNYFEITDSGKSAVLSTHTTVATYIGLTIIRADFPMNSRRKRSSSANVYGSGFDINLSYDGVNYGDTMTLIIYNDECYNCNASTFECTLKPSCPTATTTTATTTEQTTSGTRSTWSATSQTPPTKQGGGRWQPPEKPESDEEENVHMGLILTLIVLAVLILAVVSALLYMKLRPSRKPSPMTDGTSTVECSQPPRQHYDTISQGRSRSPPPRYDTISPVPHSDKTPTEQSESRPQTASGIHVYFENKAYSDN
ncbi:von Willebrand factor D and EGF domain-containing protein-like [Saccostrea cucullata]|uniref:von Willebrand factor D and EGF domain-containing protein-like n=1 Tax=Saccostrea cuccullata TaxID=36930 RepID=UPI002ED11CBD